MSNKPNGNIKDIEREIDRDRAHFSETLSALESKFSPGQMVDQALDYARRNGGDFSDNLVKTIANNPLPTILTGIGVAWMAMSQGRANAQPDYGSHNTTGTSYETGSYGANGSNGSSKLAGAKDKAKGLGDSAHKVGDRASQLAGNARHSAEDMSARGRQQWARTSNNAVHFFQENPLAVGAAAVAIGALLGAAIPATAREKELMGSKGAQVADKAKSMAEDAKQTATEAGKAGIQAAKDRAQESRSMATES